MPTWFSQCWSQCVQWGIEITKDVPEIAHQQQHDNELMILFAWQGFQDADLALLNRCQMYLHIILLLDICNRTGTGIRLHYWAGSMVADIYQFQWPTMVKPTTGEGEFWQCRLQRA